MEGSPASLAHLVVGKGQSGDPLSAIEEGWARCARIKALFLQGSQEQLKMLIRGGQLPPLLSSEVTGQEEEKMGAERGSTSLTHLSSCCWLD